MDVMLAAGLLRLLLLLLLLCVFAVAASLAVKEWKDEIHLLEGPLLFDKSHVAVRFAHVVIQHYSL